MSLAEGWYLMSVADLELELALHRGEARAERSNALRLSISEALAYKAGGNVPDELGRSLRLVLFVKDDGDAARLGERRLEWEPDFHDAPTWRRDGSVPVNIVPLRTEAGAGRRDGESWLDDPALAALEEEWRASGAVAGVSVPAEYRAFVYKTVLALKSSGRVITVATIVDSIERWLDPDGVRALRAALEAAND